MAQQNCGYVETEPLICRSSRNEYIKKLFKYLRYAAEHADDSIGICR